MLGGESVLFIANNSVICYSIKKEVIFLGYSRDEILQKCKVAFDDIKTFYKQPFINYNGRTYDTNEYYTEVIADFLCNNISSYIKGIPLITREASYKTADHDGYFDEDTPCEIDKIIEATTPKAIIPVHTENSEWFLKYKVKAKIVEISEIVL